MKGIIHVLCCLIFINLIVCNFLHQKHETNFRPLFIKVNKLKNLKIQKENLYSYVGFVKRLARIAAAFKKVGQVKDFQFGELFKSSQVPLVAVLRVDLNANLIELISFLQCNSVIIFHKKYPWVLAVTIGIIPRLKYVTLIRNDFIAFNWRSSSFSRNLESRGMKT